MALFGTSGGLISTVLGSVGGLLGGTIGGLANVAGGVIGGLTQPGSSNLPVSVGPVVQATPVAASGSAVRGAVGLFTARSAVMAMVAPILIKIAQKLGRRTMSVRGAIRIVKRMGRWLEPASIAAALGITLNELAQLIFASSQAPRRRRNPANVKALRRAMGRVEAFHKLCVKADSLRSRGRRGRGKACATGSPLVVRGG